MRVIYFHQHFTIPSGSGGIRSYEFAKKLIAHGHEVIMVCGSAQGSKSGLNGEFKSGMRQGMVDGINVVELALPYSNHDGFFKRAAIFLRYAYRSIILALKLDYDLVFATSTPLTASIPGIFAKIIRKKPFIFEVRDLWPELPRAMGVIKNPVVLKMMDILETLSYKNADACIGLSPGIVAGIKRKIGVTKKVAMLPNGCDLELFELKRCTFDLPEQIKPGDLVALFAGAHGIANGLDAVLDAASELKARHRNDIKFLFVGDGRLKPTLQKCAAQENLDNCVFLDPLPKNDMPKLFASVHVGLMVLANVPAFYYGTSPNKFFDYLAAGLPVLNNYPGWLAELITEHNCGVAIPPVNKKVFAEGLIDLADNRKLLEIYGSNAKLLAKDFARSQLSDQFVSFIELLAKK